MRAAVSLAAQLMAAGCTALLAAGCTVLLAAGCTVPAEEPTPVLRASSQLPEAERQLLEAWRSRGSDWPLVRERALEDPRLASFLVDNALLDLIRAWQRGEFTFTEAGGYEEVRAEVLALVQLFLRIIIEHQAPVVDRGRLVDLGPPTCGRSLLFGPQVVGRHVIGRHAAPVGVRFPRADLMVLLFLFQSR